MASTPTQSSSSSGSIGSGQSSTMASIPSYQMLNHTLPVKLDRTNYILWRSQIDNVIFANGFEDFIDGTSICPEKDLSPGVMNPAFVAWRRQDRTILSWIYSSLTPGIMAQIIGHNTSHSAWNALESIFSSSSRARIMQLRLELQSTKKGSMSMIDYIMKIKGAADNLAAIGEPVSEQDQVMNLLGGLGSDYNAVVTAINIRDDKISLEAIHSMLLAFEHRLEQQSSIEQMSANYASSSNNRGGGRKFNGGRGQGYSPNNNNYTYRGRGRGGRNGQGGRQNSSPSEKPQCQLCGKFGHTAQICYHRFDISFQGGQTTISHSLNNGNQNNIPAMVASASNNPADESWYLDSGASHHLTQNLGNLTSTSPYTGTDKVTIGNGKHLSISNIGSKQLHSHTHSFRLKKVFHVPFISANLISVAKFCSENNALIEFHSNAFFVKDLHTKMVLAQGKLENGLYKFPVFSNLKPYSSINNASAFHSQFSSTVENKAELWHNRLGHASFDIVSKVMNTCNVASGKYKSFVCSDCQYTWFYSLQTKDQALPIFKQFKLQMENQFDTKIKCLQSDNGGEFRSFTSFLQAVGIAHRFSCPYNSAQNGRVERKHRHVVETGLALLSHASLPMKYWHYAFQTATFLINRMPSKVLEYDSPYFTLFRRHPDYKSFRVFGCLCYPFIRPYNTHKLQYRSVQCLFLGYSLNHKGFLCLDYATGRVYITPHVVFDESTFPLAQSKSSSSSNDTSAEGSTPALITPPSFPCFSQIQKSVHAWYNQEKTILDLSAIKVSEPSTLKQAFKDPNWTKAMEMEIAALHRNHTWDLVEQPPNVNVIGCKWVYKLKHKPDGSIERYKARLVAKGYNQTHGLDYFETFSPVVKAATIRIILTVALSFKWEIRQLDVHNAFLNGELEEQVYMSQPPGYFDPQFPNRVCRLKKALYGLKQAPRAWFQRLSSALLQWGFSMSRTDSSMFLHFGKATTLIVLVYVDDILVTGSSSTQISSLIAKLDSVFALRDLGQLSFFLGIEVSYNEGSMTLSQTKYISDLLHRTELFDTKPANTPGAVGKNLSKFDGDPMTDVTHYRSVVGALQYVTLTRPDIAFAVNKACQFMQQPTTAHWLSVKRILRYLRGTMQDGLLFSPSSNLTIEGFTDADWGAHLDDRRSSSGYLVYLGGNLVSWSSTKQKVVSRSSAESEYRGLVFATAEIVWMQALLQELCVPIPAIPLLWYDNISAYHMAKNPVFHARTKHIEIDLHFIRDQVMRGKIQLQFVPTEEQPVDLLTKHLTSSRFLSLKSQLCIAPRPFHLRGDDKPRTEENRGVGSDVTRRTEENRGVGSDVTR
ncbi:Retrovirus-related Pol polyprotein from transposon TNT 1-94 [Vitis vinifera]|uniref:Retrovirus-related Pol polyprotein from transposon TNT 1-94 n=1 Tax=Vitis vinifera TaxID=29760 RepID=A0A438CVN7_VITVI|nr:Retrovirus-related Pol polyprotein from transposon TNT 1-94 [Vitis vinifera]